MGGLPKPYVLGFDSLCIMFTDNGKQTNDKRMGEEGSTNDFVIIGSYRKNHTTCFLYILFRRLVTGNYIHIASSVLYVFRNMGVMKKKVSA